MFNTFYKTYCCSQVLQQKYINVTETIVYVKFGKLFHRWWAPLRGVINLSPPSQIAFQGVNFKETIVYVTFGSFLLSLNHGTYSIHNVYELCSSSLKSFWPLQTHQNYCICNVSELGTSSGNVSKLFTPSQGICTGWHQLLLLLLLLRLLLLHCASHGAMHWPIKIRKWNEHVITCLRVRTQPSHKTAGALNVQTLHTLNTMLLMVQNPHLHDLLSPVLSRPANPSHRASRSRHQRLIKGNVLQFLFVCVVPDFLKHLEL